jgi:hypothetical protein
VLDHHHTTTTTPPPPTPPPPPTMREIKRERDRREWLGQSN